MIGEISRPSAGAADANAASTVTGSSEGLPLFCKHHTDQYKARITGLAAVVN